MIIIGYIHICQLGNWQIPFDMIMKDVKSNGLYEATLEIRVCIVNNNEGIIDDIRFHDPKIVLVAHGVASRYERLTLEHMSENAFTDPCCCYWYAHTKGIRYFGSDELHKASCVSSWIKLMTHYNFVNWRNAVACLQTHDVYGCEYHDKGIFPRHYSGNFWWANSQYIKQLPKKVGDGYLDPEFWLLQIDYVKIFNSHSTGYAPAMLYMFNANI